MPPMPTTPLYLLLCFALLTACATPTTPPTEVRYVTREIPAELKACADATRPPPMLTQRELAAWLTPEVLDGWACRLGVERLDELQ